MKESKTTAEAMEELNAALRNLGREIGKALPLEWVDRHAWPIYLGCLAVLVCFSLYLFAIGETLSGGMLLLVSFVLRLLTR